MAGRDQTLSGYDLTQPEWCGDFLGREQLVPGGAKVDITQFPAVAAVTVTVVNTAVPVATAKAGNIGNGTVGSITADVGAPPETWTLTLKTVQANAGIFSVTGSKSGAGADAVVGVAYNHPNGINFTIADGSTDFALGDTFTIPLLYPAAAGATAIPVAALATAVPAGTTLNFGIPGLVAFAPNGAAQGATSIVVAPLARPIPAGSTYTVPARIGNTIMSGTVVGRTLAQRDAKSPFHLALDADEEIYVVAFTRPHLERVNEIDLVRKGASVIIKENFLPGFSGLSATIKAYLRAQYSCTTGAP